MPRRFARVLQQVRLHLRRDGENFYILVSYVLVTQIHFLYSLCIDFFRFLEQYGYSYLEAGKNVMILFKEKGWSIIISDNLISNVLSLFCFIIGGLTGCVGLVMSEINPSWFEGYGDASMIVAFG